MNLEQIKNAQIDALYASVIDALLKSKTVLDVFQQQYGKFITQNTLQRERVARVENWAILQKTNYGFDMLTSAACKALKLGGVTPDCWVVDDGVKQYVANVRRENFQYFLAGPRGQTMYESALGNKTGKAVDVASGLLIHEAKHFDLPDIEEPHNLLSRPRMIGEYNVMYPHMTPDASYNSDWRAILVYDEKRDGFRRIGLCDAINGCARWNHFGEIDFPDGFDSKDMFMKADGNPVRHFGDMDLDGLPRKARDDWVASVLNKLDDEIANDVEALVSLCEQLDPTDIDSVRSLSSDTKGKKGKVLEPVGPVPFGYGNAAGIDELSHEGYASVAEYKEYHQLAKKAMRALRTIKKVADSLTDEDHKLTDDEIVSSLIDKQLYPIIDMYGDDNEQTLYRKLSEFRSDRLTNDYAQQVINAPGFEFDDFLNFAFAPTYDGDHSAALDAPGQVVNGNLQKEAYLIGSDGSKLGETDETREIYEVFTDGLTFFKDLVRKKQLDKLDDARKNKIGQIIFALSLNIDSVDFYNLVSRLDESNLITFLKNVDINIQRGGKEEKEARFLELIKDADDRDVQNRNFKFSGLSSTKQLYQNVLRAFTVESSSYEANFQAALENMAFEEGEINLQGQRVTGARAGDTYGGSGKRRAVVKGGVLTIERGSGSGDAGDLYAKGKSKPVERFFHELLLKLPVTQQTLCMFAESDLVVPFNFILFRPRMTYRMSSGVCLKTGSSTGETLVGHADFQLGDNVVRKVYYGNFTTYSRAVVYNHRQTYLAEDMLCTGYEGGNDCTMFRNVEDLHLNPKNSMFVCIAPYQQEEYANPMDITGKDRTHGIGGLHDEKQYATADYYSEYWGESEWSHDSRPADKDYAFDMESHQRNTECFQGHQSMYNPNTKLHDIVTQNTGHWGPRVYPGCGKARTGLQKVLEEVHFNNVLGGGGQSAAIRLP